MSRITVPLRQRIRGPLVLALAVLLAGCTTNPSTPVPAPVLPTSLSPTPAPPVPTGPTSSVAIAEPTTTNTLPPPPAPTGPAPSVAGDLSAASLPVPAGWRTAVASGGEEEGFQGNGTWVHARDPRYAAQDVVTLGCADVTRDDYRDPVAALEGRYRRGDKSGVGLVLQFGDAAAARRYFAVYTAQVRACEGGGSEVSTTVVAEPTAADGGRGLVDRRRYPDASWTEVAELNGDRLTLLVLGDPGHRISRATAQRVLDQIRP